MMCGLGLVEGILGWVNSGKLFQVGLELVYEWFRGLYSVCLRCYSVLVQVLVRIEFC